MLLRKRVLHSLTDANSWAQIYRALMMFRRGLRIGAQVALALIVLGTATNLSRAGDGGSCCRKEKPFVTIGFYAKACARYPYEIRVEGGLVSTGSGVCDTDGWTSADRILIDLKPNVTYQFSVSAGETCSSHFNFYDIPEGYRLEIDGVETTTIDKVSERGYGGNGTWSVVVRECRECGTGPSGTPTGPDVGSVVWAVGLGNLSDGRPAGGLSLRENQLTAGSYSPDALIYSPPPNTSEVDVTQNASGNHRQIKVPESLADILVISATEYDIRFYRASDVGSKDGSGLYALTGSPYVTYTIKNPEPATTTKLQIVKTESGGTPEVNEYTWDPLIDLWTLSRNNGARTETKVVSYPTDTSRTETFTIREGLQLISKIARTYHTYEFGEELAQEVVDPDGAALTTSYTYYEDANEIRWHKIKSITYPDGSWVKYDYDNNGNLALILRPWKDLTLASATEENARATRYTYTNSDGINSSFTPRFVATVTEKVAGVTVGSTTHNRVATNVNGNPAIIHTETVYSSVGVSQATITTTYDSGAIDTLAGRVASTEYPDGRKDSYTYEKGNFIPNADPSLNQFIVDSNGLAERQTMTSGTTSSPDGIAFKSTRNTVIRDNTGNQVFEETYVYNGASYERIGWTAFTYDGRGHVTQTRQHTGETSSAVWTADKRTSSIDESGIETTYTYDTLGRLKDSVKKGIAAGGGFPAQTDITTTTNYDAAGRVTSQTVNGVGVSTSKSTTYDPAGRIKTTTDELGRLTSYTYANGGRTQTVTRPGGATEVTDNYLDRRAKSVTGSAVVASYFDYGVNLDGTRWDKNYIGNSGLSSPRWTKTTTDWMGRTTSIEKPSFTGTNVVQSSIYNALGQLEKKVTTAGATKLIADTLYQYDELGRQTRSGLDVNGDGSLTAASTDRLTENETVFEKTGTDWFTVSSSKTYLINNNATATVTVQRTRLNNFPLNGTQQTISDVTVIDPSGNNTHITVEIDRAAKKRTITTDTPDSNVNAVEISVNGLLQSSIPTTPQLATTYLYDPLGRQISVTDPGTTTKTRSYNATTGQLTATNNGAGTTQYLYHQPSHMNAGLLKTQINPANKKIYFNYNGRGEMVQTWGDATYPKELVYDSYGQRTELHTFRGGQNWSATEWPTALTGSADVTKWIYQESTGLVTQKQDAALKGATYTYDELGRLKTRVWARGITCTYNYDVNTGELLTVTYSDSTPAVTFVYDRGGRQTNITDASGARVRTFTVAGELETEQTTGGILDGVSLTVGYDSFLRRNSLQTSQGGNPLSSQTYGYDASSRLQTVTSGSQTATYAYYPNTGLLNTTTFTGGTSIARSYDTVGRLENITTTPAAGVPQSFVYMHNNLNQRTRVTREDGSYWSYDYTDRGEVKFGKKFWSDNSIVWGAQTEYSYDNLGNRIYARNGGNQLATLRQSDYTTNSLNQHTQRTVPAAVDLTGTANTSATVTVNNEATARKGDYFYKELAVNNTSGPVSQQINVTGARANFGPGGEDAITQKGGRVFLPAATESFTYDFDGNLTGDGRWIYTWNAENQLVSMEAAPAVPVDAKSKLEFSYDYDGRRIQKKIYSWDIPTSSYQLQSNLKFVYDGWNLVAELDATTLVRAYCWSGMDLLLISGGGTVYHVGADGNQNIGTLVNSASGAIAASYEYDSFGVTLKAIGPYAEDNPLRFSSQYTDRESGFLYYGHRLYNPQTGRWVSRDPSEENGGINLYAFARNDGVNKIDLLGLTDYSSIARRELSYSCNCGWIDWNHANPGPGDRYGTGQLWKTIYNESGPRSRSRSGYYTQYGQSYNAPVVGKVLQTYYNGMYYVKYGLSWNDKVRVALSIVKEVSEGFEHFQRLGGGNSSFSEEDLVSDLIAINMAIKGYDRTQISNICGALDIRMSQDVYRDNFGEAGSPGKSRKWTPNYYDIKKCKYCEKNPTWPYAELYTMQDIPKGELWRDWHIYADTDLPIRGGP